MKGLSRVDLLVALGFLLAAGVFLGDTLFGGKVLLPLDNLYRIQPYRSLAGQLGVLVPHNDLISDMLLENVAWRRFAAEVVHAGQIPLWNPNTFAGMPFLATGQYGTLYPLGVLFYLMSPERAYGWFTALHLVIGALSTYAYLRVIGGGRVGGVVGGLTFAFSGCIVVSFLWPQVLGTVIWLPLLLTIVELVIRSQESGRTRWAGVLVAGGGLALGTQFYGNHFEISFYLLFTLLFYTVARLTVSLVQTRRIGPTMRSGLLLLGMVAIGVAVGAAQLLPFLEVVSRNFRTADWSTYEQVLGYALPKKQALVFLMPDFFGNPAQHSYLDVLRGVFPPVPNNALGQPTDPPRTIYWGVKNYVEATGYVGILPLVLSVVAVLLVRTRYAAIFAAYAVFALLLILGTPLYAIFYFGIPGIEQLHTPFRWIFPYTVSVSVLAGLGAGKLYELGRPRPKRKEASLASGPAAVGQPEATAHHSGQGTCHPERSEGSVVPEDSQGADSSLAPLAQNDRGAVLPQNGGVAPSGSLSVNGEGWGGGRLLARYDRHAPLIARLLGLGTLGAGLLLLAGLAGSLALHDRVIARLDQTVHGNEAIARAFADGRMFFSYEFVNLAKLGLLLVASGLVVWLALRPRVRRIWPALAALLVAADLFIFGYDFNSRTDPSLLDARPPSVDFLVAAKERAGNDLFRIVSFGDEDVLKPNTATFYDLQDVRGYDSIIPRQYVEYWSLMEPPNGLPYTAINKLTHIESLSSKYLDLLNVRYVLTTQQLNLPDLKLVYDREVRIYERASVLPRAFLVPSAHFVADSSAALAALREPGFDPRREVVVEGTGQTTTGGASGTAQIESYGASDVTIRVRSNGPSYLLLADSYYPDWLATVDGTNTTVYRADGNFRAVAVPDGEHLVAFKYSPNSFKLGLFATLLGLSVIALLLMVALWQRLTGGSAESGSAQRVGRNSLAPLATSLFNKTVDIAFAMLMLRLLGAESAGKYYFAVVVIGYLDILTGFGLNALLIREVARDPSARHRYLTGSLLLRLGIWLATVPLCLGGLYLGRGPIDIRPDALLVIAVLAVSLLPSNVSSALSSLFYAFERMEHPSALTVVTNLLRIGLGAVVLLAGWGILGLAGVSLAVNLVNLSLFLVLSRRVLGPSRFELRPGLLREMLVASYPLMLNNLLATLFFKIDSVLLKGLQGDVALGYYSTAYKLPDGLQVIPSSFVFAIFPLMSRRAGEGADSVRRAYVLALRVLVGIAMPIAVATTFLATPLVLILGGPEFLPHSAIALAVLIWFLPFGFANGVTQYVLIAINQQRFITWSFVFAAGFNVVANLYAIPRYGYVGAAVVTILSEFALMAPFHYAVRRHLGSVPLVSLFARFGVAAAGMAAILWLGRDLSILLTLPASFFVYLGALVLDGAISRKEMQVGWQMARGWLEKRRGRTLAAETVQGA